MKLLIL